MAGLTATYISATSFSVLDDLTENFLTGRRIKADCGVDGIKYGTILSSSYGSVTTVVLTSTSDALTSNLTEVWFGIIGAENNKQSMPEHSHDGTEASGGGVDIIQAGNSKVEVVDGTITVEATDGNIEVDITDSGLRLGGADSRVNQILDEDDMSSDLATALITQQSAKAFGESLKTSIIGNYAGINLLDNPAFSIAQLMYPTAPVGVSGYNQAAPDRWFFDSSGAVRYTCNQDTVQPDIGDTGYDGIIPEDVGIYAMNMNTTTATGTPGATDYGVFGQKIPVSKILPLILNTSTFSFWIRPGTTGTYCVVLRNGGYDSSSPGVPGAGTYSYVMREFVVTTANQWQKIIVNFPKLTDDTNFNDTSWGPPSSLALGGQSGSFSSLRLDFNENIGLELIICLFAGSSFNGGIADGTWKTGPYYASSNQTNNSVATGNFRINQPKLEVGNVATQFMQPDFSIEMAKALRYYEKIRVNADGEVYCYGETLTTTTSRFFLPFLPKRHVPSIGDLTASASSFDVIVGGTAYAVSSFDSYTFTRQGVEIEVTHAATTANRVAALVDGASGTTFINIDAKL